jgi:hypothetical protein
MNDPRVGELLDGLSPDYSDRQGDWEAVVAGARRSRARTARIGLAFAVVAAAAVAVLAWPSAERGGVLERALAAVGEGPILHAVLRGEWGGTEISLETGARRPVHGETEVWYDLERGRLRMLSRMGTVVTSDLLHDTDEPPAHLEALGRDYREALETGSARVVGEGTVDSEPVVWITIRSELLPDVADGKEHGWAQQVAVSRRTFKPVALRETRDGKVGPNTQQRVLRLELRSERDGDFTAAARPEAGASFKTDRTEIELEQAISILGAPPLWLGPSHAGLPLGAVYRETTSIGRREGERGPVVWEEDHVAVVFFYATLGDDPSTFRKERVPLANQPLVSLTESTTETSLHVLRPAGGYVPPEGSVFVAAGARRGIVRAGGVTVEIAGGHEQAILAAARALEPAPD